MTADYHCALFWRQAHAGIVVGLVVRLVLKRYRKDRQTLRLIPLDPPPKILRERAVESGQECALDETSRRLHPAWRAPRAADELELRIDGESALEQRNPVSAVDVDREMRERRVRLACRPIVIAVVRAGEVGRSHRQSKEAEADTGLAPEKLLKK